MGFLRSGGVKLPPSNRHVSTLPDEVMARVFRWLPVNQLTRAAQVCQRWKAQVDQDAVYDSRLAYMGFTDAYAPSPPSFEDLASMRAIDVVTAIFAQAPTDRMAGDMRFLTLAGTDPKSAAASAPAASTTAAAAAHAGVAQAATSPTGAVNSGEAKAAAASAALEERVTAMLRGESGRQMEAAAGVVASPTAASETASPTATATAPQEAAVSPASATSASSDEVVAKVRGDPGLPNEAPAATPQAAPNAVEEEEIPIYRLERMRKKIPVPAPIKKRASRDLFRIMFTTLVPLFRDFEYHHGEATKLFKTHPDGLHRAFFLAKLHRLASVAWMVNTTVCRASIVKTMDNYEQSLFAGFEVAYNAKNVAEMQRTAQICALLNGGMGCVQTYITKHPVFYDTRLNPSLLITTVTRHAAAAAAAAAGADKATSSPLASPAGKVLTKRNSQSSMNPPVASGSAAKPPLALQLLTARGWDLSDQFVAHMSRLEAMCVQDLQMMAVIFVPQVNAGTKFITKVMDDAVSDYLEVTLRQAQQSENTEVFLHTTAACIHACSTFLEAVIHAVPDRPPGVPGAVRVDSIKRNLHGMLLPFIAEHLTLEINYLLQRYDRVIKAWEIKQNEEREERKLRALNEKLSGAAFLKTREAARAHKNKALETIRTILFAPLALGRTVVSALGVIDDGPKKTVSPFVEFGITDTLTGETLQSNLSLDLCMNFVQHNREALGRVLVVTAAFHAPRLRDNVEAVFVPVLNTIAQHVEIGFKRALGTMQAIPAPSRGATSIDNPEARDAAERATLEFFEMIHLGDVIQQMLDVYYSQDVQPWVNSQDFLAPHVASKKAFERRLDAHVAAGMEYSLQVTAVQVEILLNKQPADDYNSKAPPAVPAVLPAVVVPVGSEELALVAPPVVDVVTTKTTQAVIQLLSRYGKLLEGALDNSSLTISLTELGTRVTTLVVDHLKTLVISQSGALVLIADLNAYYEWASCFHLPSLRQELNALKELGNLFLAEDATGLADMRQAIVRAGRWRIEDLQDLLRQRADWSKISKQLDGKECCIQ